MPCYRPLHAFNVGEKNYKIFGHDVVALCDDGVRFHPLTVDMDLSKADYKEYVRVPCRQCVGCRLDYARSWSDRLMIELQDHDSAYFLTLTIDQDHIDQFRAVDPETGELQPWASLDKRTCQLFLKRLREAHRERYPDRHLMYYLAGEYGDHTFRPHYHAIVFDLVLDDLQLWNVTDGNALYTSAFLDAEWQLGRVIVGAVTQLSCAYTARYILKKQNGKANNELYERHGLQKEFTLISTKPAIGRKYFEGTVLQNKIFGNVETLNIRSPDGGIKVRMPKYYDRLMEQFDPDRLLEVKEIRKADAEVIEQLKLSRTSKSYYEMLLDDEKNKQSEMRRLRRNYDGTKNYETRP